MQCSMILNMKTSSQNRYFFDKPFIFLKRGLTQSELTVVQKAIQKKSPHFADGSVYLDKKGSKKIPKIRKVQLIFWSHPKINSKLKKKALSANQKAWKYPHNFKVLKHQIALYGRGDHYDWHTDSPYWKLQPKTAAQMGLKNFERTLTCIVLINDGKDFSGGELELISLSGKLYKIPFKKAGEMVVFPSAFLHRVKKVKRGQRITLTTWLLAPYKN